MYALLTCEGRERGGGRDADDFDLVGNAGVDPDGSTDMRSISSLSRSLSRSA